MSNGPSIQANKERTPPPNRTATERREENAGRRRVVRLPLLLAIHLSLIALALSLPKKTDAVSEPPLLNATVNGVRLAAGRQAGR